MLPDAQIGKQVLTLAKVTKTIALWFVVRGKKHLLHQILF
jgi:hypothetical protein